MRPALRAVVTVVVIGLAAGGCSSGQGESASSTASAAAASTTNPAPSTTVRIAFVTTDPNIAGELDPGVCPWGEARFTIEDGDGQTLHADDIDPGVFRNLPTGFECRTQVLVDVPDADFYEVTVTGGAIGSQTQTYSRAEASASPVFQVQAG